MSHSDNTKMKEENGKERRVTVEGKEEKEGKEQEQDKESKSRTTATNAHTSTSTSTDAQKDTEYEFAAEPCAYVRIPQVSTYPHTYTSIYFYFLVAYLPTYVSPLPRSDGLGPGHSPRAAPAAG